EATSEHVLLLIPQLRLLSMMRKQVGDRMQELMDEIAKTPSDTPDTQILRDISVLQSFPGIGRIIAGAFLAEAARPLRQRDYRALRAHGGIAPVTRQSGKSRQVGMRYRCNTRLRNALYHWGPHQRAARFSEPTTIRSPSRGWPYARSCTPRSG